MRLDDTVRRRGRSGLERNETTELLPAQPGGACSEGASDAGSAGVPEALRFILEQPVSERVAHKFGAAPEPELLHHVGPVRLGGPDGDEQSLGDFLVCVAVGKQGQYF